MTEGADLQAGFAGRLRELRERAGNPSYEVLARLTAGTRWPQTRSTIYDKLSGKSVPSEEFVRAFASACLAHARRAGRHLDGQDADPDWWAGECSRVRREVTQARREVTQARRAGVRLPNGAVAARRLVRDWDPFVLGVHHAIRVGVPAARLPAYVRRPHDDELGALIAPLTESAGAAPQLIILVGGSSTGKTRAAYEAAMRYLPDWAVAFPAAAEDLIGLLQAGKITRRTVVWLNEAQTYLGASDAAAVLRWFLAEGPVQVIMLGTLWPAYRDDFTAVPATGQPDTYRHARELLSTAAIVTVPDRFTIQEIEQAREVKDDPRLAAAVEGSGSTGRVTQILAAGLDLVSRFSTADSYSRAVVLAAMDAAGLGCSAPLPAGYLRKAAEGYLDDEARADPPADWWEQSLAYVTAKVRQAVAMLSPARVRPGLGEADGYKLADYLAQHGRRARAGDSVPSSTWQALHDAITDTRDRSSLAQLAELHGFLRYACLLAREPAGAGDVEAAECLARVLRGAGHPEEAAHYQHEAALVDHRIANSKAMKSVQTALDRAQHTQSGEQHATPPDVPGNSWRQEDTGPGRESRLRESARDGDLRSRVKLSWYLHKEARPDEAVGLWLADAEDGDADAMLRAASVLELNGRLEEAAAWYRRASADASSFALIKLTALLEYQGKATEAIDAWRSAAEQGKPYAMRELASLLARAHDNRQAEHWYRRATVFGVGSVEWLAEFLESTGRKQEAKQVRCFGIEPDGTTAHPW